MMTDRSEAGLCVCTLTPQALNTENLISSRDTCWGGISSSSVKILAA